MRSTLAAETRFFFWSLIVPIVPFGLLLWFLPNFTYIFWAWEVGHPRSSILVGTIYIAAPIYFFLILRSNEWLRGANVVGHLVIFSVVLIVATMFHWDRFRPNYWATLVWLIFYYGVPLLLPIFARLQQGREGNVSLEGADISPGWRAWLILRGIVYTALAILIFIFAPAISPAWPWPITLLNLRVFVAQIAAVGWYGLTLLIVGPLWRRHRLGLSFMAALGGLQLLGLLVSQSPYNWSAPFGILLPLMFAEWVVTPLILLALYRRK